MLGGQLASGVVMHLVCYSYSNSRRRFWYRLAFFAATVVVAAACRPNGETDRAAVSAVRIAGAIAGEADSALYYETAGSGDPVLLIHGLGLDRRMWEAQVTALASTHRIIRFDLPGAGRSAVPLGTYKMADAAARVLSAAGVARAHVVGLSLGGEVAIDLALTYPDRVRSLVLLDAAVGGWAWSQPLVDRVGRYIQSAQTTGVAAANASWLGDELFAPARRDSVIARQLSEMVLEYPGTFWLHPDWQQGPTPPAIQRLETIQAPTLIVIGELDLPDFHHIADTVAARVPQARRVLLPGIGHMANMEAPSEVNQLMLDFWRNTPR